MWFEPAVLSKNKTETLANFANPANWAPENSKTETPISKLAGLAEGEEHKTIIVTCYSPSGLTYEVEATSSGHAEFLERMNPNRT